MPDEISPEDRERLAKVKFSEWFDENLHEKFNGVFDARLMEFAQLTESKSSKPVRNAPTREEPSERPKKKRSLLDICLEQSLGIG